MAIQIPTFDQVYNQILNDYATEMEINVSELGDQYKVDAKVDAAQYYQMYLLVSDVQNNIYSDKSELSELRRDGLIELGRDIAPGEQGVFTASVTGQIGSTISASTQFVSNADALTSGNLYVVDADFTLTATTDYITIRSLDIGQISALNIGDNLTSIQPLVNADDEITITEIQVAPQDPESAESYRADVLESKRLTAQGGSPSDWRLWSSDVPEVFTIYPFLQQGYAGNVEVYVEATKENTAVGEITGVPTQETLDAVYKAPTEIDPESGALVYNVLTGRGRRPVGVLNIICRSIQPIPVDIEFTGLSDESISQQIKDAIDESLYTVRPFVAGGQSYASKNDILTDASIIAAIIGVLDGTGISYNSIVMKINGQAETSYRFLWGYIPHLRYVYNDSVHI